MEKYYNLLGLHIDEVCKFFDKQNIKYTINTIAGKKDKDKLIIPRVIKISENHNNIEIVVTNFSDSLK